MAEGGAGSDAASFHAIQKVAARLEKGSGSESRQVGTTVLRVAQLDSERLTYETWSQLKQQFRKAFTFLEFATGWELELDTLLSLMVFRHTIWNKNQTYGDRLHNVIYRSDMRARQLGKFREVHFSQSVAPTKVEKVLLCLASVVIPYLYSKLLKKSQDDGWGDSASDGWKRRVHDILYQMETAVRIVSLVNLLIFIRDGEFRNIVDRVLGLRLVNHKSKINKLSSFEFMNRQLWWKYATEFLTFVLPFINFMPYLRRMLRSRSSVVSVINTTTCPICMMNPIQIPYVSNCGHHFCYYCIQSRLAQKQTTCPACASEITNISRPPPRRT